MAHPTKVEALHPLTDSADCPRLFEHAEPSARAPGLRETTERS